VRLELVFERNTSCESYIQGGDRLCLLQIGLFSWVEETHVSLQTTPSVLEAGASSTLPLCDNWVNFWKEYFLLHRFSKVELGSLCSRYAFSADFMKHISLGRTPCMLETVVSSKLFPCENSVSIWKEYFLQIMHLRCRKAHFSQIGLFS
jgi:hypothetical protein